VTSTIELKRFRWVVAVLAILAAIVFFPFWSPLIMAAWTAHLARPLVERLERSFGGKRSLAAIVTLLIVLLVIVPLAIVITSVAIEGVALVKNALSSPKWRGALESIVTNGDSGGVSFKPDQIMNMARQYGTQAFNVLGGVFDLVIAIAVGLFVFTLGTYSFMVDGGRIWAWFILHAPLARQHVHRLVDAFYETGRGMFIGVGMTALAQASLATIMYIVLGVPRALVLGVLSLFCAFIPNVGTTLVWIPVALGLYFTGHPAKAAILVAYGCLVVGTIDNILAPALARWGKLRLPMFALVLAMLGGLALFGPFGLLLGPLVVRMAREALALAREEGLIGDNAPSKVHEREEELPAE
jgi:predicted PurR-regulated permease PerM